MSRSPRHRSLLLRAISPRFTLLGAWLLAAVAVLRTAAAAEAAPAAPGEAAPTTTETPAQPPAAAQKTAAPRRKDPDATLPLRLGVFFGHAFGQSGDLTRYITGTGGVSFQLPSPAAVGVDIGTGLGSHVRYHFAVALEWEGQSQAPGQPEYAAKGFRFDLVGLGFPIKVWSNEELTIHAEPLLHLIRGEILFQSTPSTPNSSLFRIESGLGAAVTVVTHHWYFGLEPFALDFRVFEANNKWVHTGFAHMFWFHLSAGYEF